MGSGGRNINRRALAALRGEAMQLEAFTALLGAKTGKGISRAQAERWSADADRIGALAGC